MKKKTYYYFECAMGCGIRPFYNINQAKKEITAEVGWANFRKVRKATKEDISHVSAMGGYIEELT